MIVPGGATRARRHAPGDTRPKQCATRAQVGAQKELRVASADALLQATRTTELAGALATLLAAPSLARAALAAFCDAAAIVRAWDAQQVRACPGSPRSAGPGMEQDSRTTFGTKTGAEREE